MLLHGLTGRSNQRAAPIFLVGIGALTAHGAKCVRVQAPRLLRSNAPARRAHRLRQGWQGSDRQRLLRIDPKHRTAEGVGGKAADMFAVEPKTPGWSGTVQDDRSVSMLDCRRDPICTVFPADSRCLWARIRVSALYEACSNFEAIPIIALPIA